MKVYIPTRSRPNSQRAHAQMTAAGLKPILVVDEDQLDLYKGFKVVPTAKGGGIAGARQTALAHAGKAKHAVFDDDTTLAAVDVDRRTGKVTIVNEPTPKRVAQEMERAEDMLDSFAHGGVHTRHFVNYAAQPFVTNRGYPRQIMFFNPRLIPTLPEYVGETAEDVIFFIKCLEQGLDYFLLTSCCMIEKKSKEVRTHFTQEGKNKDMLALGAQYEKYVRPTADGRITLSYSKILKDAKARIEAE